MTAIDNLEQVVLDEMAKRGLADFVASDLSETIISFSMYNELMKKGCQPGVIKYLANKIIMTRRVTTLNSRFHASYRSERELVAEEFFVSRIEGHQYWVASSDGEEEFEVDTSPDSYMKFFFTIEAAIENTKATS